MVLDARKYINQEPQNKRTGLKVKNNIKKKIKGPKQK